MFRTARTTLAASLFALTFAGTVHAQSLDGKVERNPDDTVTYTIDLDGPPRGTGYVFAAINLVPNPVPMPFGALHLDPRGVLSLGAVRLDANGRGNWQFRIPMQIAPDYPIYFQSLYNDRGILRLSQNYMSLLHCEAPVDNSLMVAIAHNSKTQTYKGEFRGPAGKTVEIVHYRGSQSDIWRGKIPANGRLPVEFRYKNALRHRDVIEIRYNGKRFKSWTR